MIKLINKLVLIFLLAINTQFSVSLAEDKHDDHKDHAEDKHEHGSDHKSEENDHHKEDEKEEHADHKEDGSHGEESEANAQVGVNKGIVEADKENGFKLSVEAEKNFDIKKIKVQSSLSVELPLSAIATSTIEVNVYRFRDGFYKRIDFNQISKNQGKISIKSPDLKAGDEIAISGLGFLRVSEIAAFDGAPEGHSH